MITLSKGMIGLAALIAAGVVGIDSLSDARPQSAASVITERFVFPADLQAPVGDGVDLTAARRDAADALAAITLPMEAMAPKGDRLDVQAADDTATHRSVRYLTVEHRIGPSASEVTRIAVTNVASR